MNEQLIGNTRLINYKGIYIKYEIDNLTGSIKDRAALSIIKNNLDLNKTLVTATSGNLGISLSKLCEKYKQNLLIIIPKTSNKKKQLMINNYTKIIETDPSLGMNGALKELNNYKYKKDYIYINQFTNLYNPLGYISLTKEIIKSFIKLDYLVIGVGSGGTYYTLNKVLKRCYPKIKIIAVLPRENDTIDGIGANVKHHASNCLNEIEYVSRSDAIDKMLYINKEGIPLGMSSSACLLVAENIKKEHSESIVLMLAHDSINRYSDYFE